MICTIKLPINIKKQKIITLPGSSNKGKIDKLLLNTTYILYEEAPVTLDICQS